ncbi:MFS transporter [Vibrio maritimus]|uniref:MFS transporter n=1 Tax=Vibrio maritimus TaxID=990268 RepID=UPI001F22AFE9|nr:MFS transporter [Vibrio maritimus]
MKKNNLWHFSQASMGIVQWIGVAIIIAPVIISRTGSAILVGQVMLILGLIGLIAPLLGALADRYSLHRQLHCFALGCHCFALIMLLLVEHTAWHYWGIAILVGLGSNLILILNPTFALKLNHNPAEQTRSLKRLFQLQMLGVAVAGIAVGTLSHFGFTDTFQIIALIILDVSLLVLTLIAPPAEIQTNDGLEDTLSAEHRRSSPSIWFGFVICVALSMFIGSNMVEFGPVIIEQAFGVTVASSAFGMAIAALATLVSLAPAGKWMENHGPQALWLVTIGINLIVAAAMWVMYGREVVALLPLSLILMSIINGAWNDISIAALADQISPFSPATSQGYMAAAVSLGFSVGTYCVGYLIDNQNVAGVVNFLAVSGIAVSIIAVVIIKLHRYQLTRQLKVEKAI